MRDMFRIVGLHGEDDPKRTKNRESRRKGNFSLIFPRSIAAKSGKPQNSSKPTLGLRKEEIEDGAVPALAIGVSVESKVVEKVEEREEAKEEEKVEPPMVPCC